MKSRPRIGDTVIEDFANAGGGRGDINFPARVPRSSRRDP